MLAPKRALGPALAVLASLFILPTDCRADENAHEAGEDSDQSGEGKAAPAPPLVPYFRDTVGGHLQVGLTGALAFPFGKLSSEAAYSERSGFGGGGALDLGYGLDRYVVLGAYGEFLGLGDSKDCDGCSATSFGAGALVRYHVSQGLRFDPWISYGLGVRSFSFKNGSDSPSYTGFEWLRLTLGGDWFATPHLGLGPLVEFSAAQVINRPDPESGPSTVFTAQFGIRAVFDTRGK